MDGVTRQSACITAVTVNEKTIQKAVNYEKGT